MSDWTQTRIDGVRRRVVAFHADGRGAFGELWRSSWSDPLGDRMRQANLSRSQAGVLRGLHVHQRQADLWIVVEGEAFVALVDIRPALAGSGTPLVEGIEAGPGDAIYLPAGVAHGFYARQDLTLLYLVSNEYDGTDEQGFAWDDADVAVPWPDQEPILSDRDAAAPTLRDTLATFRLP